ncbi:MAG TPA: SDR family oxidoreductase [Parasulfuritortus sp.]
MLIVITGVSRGLGRAMATEFIRYGHTVYGCGRNVKAVHELASRYPSPHRFDIVDVTLDQQVAAWARSCLASGLIPDLLLNNAAQINHNAPLWEIRAVEFDAVVDVNIKGVANVIRHFVPAMAARRKGVIVNFSSEWGRSTDPEVAPYCATKWAVEGLTKALAQELPEGMAAIPLSPGVIDTDMLRSCFGSQASAYPTAEEWAKTAAPWILGLSAKDNGRSLTVGEAH